MQDRPVLVDLFCGCGGFALGAQSAGLAPALALDVDPILTSSFGSNHPATKLALADLSTVQGSDIRREVGGRIDGLFGGPPCQGFSSIGRRLPDDPRRSLLGHFFRLVRELRPSFFVMENVRGLAYADAQPVLDRALELVPSSYRVLRPMFLDASAFGAATTRPRLFVVGYRPDRLSDLNESDFVGEVTPATVRDAIFDLVSARQIEDVDGFDNWKIVQPGRPGKYSASLRAMGGTFTGHRRTAHSPEVVKRFRSTKQGATEEVGRHHRLDWSGQCPTLRAGTGSDRGSYQSVRPLHPQEPRVITVREAARLQGFPDSFRFHPTIWHSFRMIGNSVSPIVARAVFSAIATKMGASPELIAAE